MVTHGGINTMSECLLNNKLVIGVPEQGEQMWNLKYVESLGIGIMVSKFKLEKNPSLLTNAIISILNEEKYKQNLDIFIQRNTFYEFTIDATDKLNLPLELNDMSKFAINVSSSGNILFFLSIKILSSFSNASSLPASCCFRASIT